MSETGAYKYHCDHCGKEPSANNYLLNGVLSNGEFDHFECSACYRIRDNVREFNRRKDLFKSHTENEPSSLNN